MPRAPRPTPVARQRPVQPALGHFGYGSNHCTAEFLTQFTDTQNQHQHQPAKNQLSAQQHAELRENADRVVSLPPAWADNTKHNIAGILKKWRRCCELMKLGDWETVLRTATKGTAISFLTHLCEEYNIRSEATGWQYFRQLKQLYAMRVGRPMDYNDCSDVRNFYKAVLKPRFSLQAPALRVNGRRLERPLGAAVVQLGPRPPRVPQRAPPARRRRLLSHPSVHGMQASRGRRWQEEHGVGRRLLGQV
ncbi:hypothetical protein AX16_004410, partial [Volvariella volvacea WC 439]